MTLANYTKKFQANRISIITFLCGHGNNLFCIFAIIQFCTSARFTWHFKLNRCLRSFYKTRLGTMDIVCIICCCQRLFALYSIRGRIQQSTLRHWHDCLRSADMAVRRLPLAEKKNSLNLTGTTEEYNSYLCIYINKLLIFRNLNKSISLRQSCDCSRSTRFHWFSKQSAFFIEF